MLTTEIPPGCWGSGLRRVRSQVALHDKHQTAQGVLVEAKRRGAVWVGTSLLVGAALFGGCFLALEHSFDIGPIGPINLNVGPRTAPSKPTIAVPPSACPYLEVVNVTANAAGEHWQEALGYETPETWRPFARQLAPKLANLELALTVSIPHVPKPVAVDFRKTLQSVNAGRPPLLISKTADDYNNRTSLSVFDGYLALSDASTLVGDACGFEFGPGAT